MDDLAPLGFLGSPKPGSSSSQANRSPDAFGEIASTARLVSLDNGVSTGPGRTRSSYAGLSSARTKKGLAWTKPREAKGKYHASQAHYVLCQLLVSIQFRCCKIDRESLSHYCDTASESDSRVSFDIESASALWAS